MVEPYIPGKELTCAVMGDNAPGVIEIVPTTEFYDYEAKYAPGGSKHCCRRRSSRRFTRRCGVLSLVHMRARLPRRYPRRLPLRRQPAGTRGLPASK